MAHKGLSQAKAAQRGQNLAELVLTLGIVVSILFTTIEIGRVWQAYTGARNAAIDGAVTASQYLEPALGLAQIDRRLTQANLTPVNRSVVAFDNGNAFQSSVTISFQPIFGGLALPTPAGDITIVPRQFDISYDSTRFYATY